MKKAIFFFSILALLFSCQKTTETYKIENETNEDLWRELEWINKDDYPFSPEQSIKGIGLVSIQLDSNLYDKKLKIYNIENNKLLATVERKDSDVLSMYKDVYYNRYDTINPINPWLFVSNPDYFRLSFDCIYADESYYTVIINEEENKKARILRNDPFFKFQKFEEFVLEWTKSGFDFNRVENPLRKNPNENSEIINHKKESDFKIWRGNAIKIKGNWIKVNIEETNETGWTKWRQNNQISIVIYYSY